MSDIGVHEQDGESTGSASSFLPGFTMGLLAGAAGYYLFATEEGQQVRERLNEEWERAKAEMVAQGVLSPGEGSLRQFLMGFLAQLAKQAYPTDEAERVHRMTTPPRKPRGKKEAGRRFKGA